MDRNNPPLTDYKNEQLYLLTQIMLGQEADYIRALRLDPTDMASVANQSILQAVYEVEAKGGEITYTQVRTHLQNTASKFVTALDDLWLSNDNVLISRSDLESIVDRLRSLAEAREVREKLFKAQSYFEEGNLQAGRDNVLLAAESLHQDRSRYHIENIGVSMRYAYDTIVNKKRKRITIGEPLLDQSIGFLSAGSTTVLGGDTTVGKSSFALYIARHMARQGHRPGIISLEDGPDVFGSRVLSSETEVPVSYARDSAPVSDQELQELREIMHRAMDNAPDIVMAYAFAATPEIILDITNRLVRDKKCDVIFFDYLQATRIDLKSGRLDKAYADVFNRTKALCFRLEVPLVVVSQLRRRSKDEREPNLYDLKESGDIENGAEVVLLAWWDGNGDTIVKLAKLKWGKRGFKAKICRDKNHGMITGLMEVS